MNCLVDTHVLLWFLFSSKKIPQKIKSLMEQQESTCYFSAVSLWEISIKYSLRKLDLRGVKPDVLYTRSIEAGLKVIDLDTNLIATFHKLPMGKNKDPFDRMLAWQAINENCVLITADRGFVDYKANGLKTVW